jgi:acylpyruvate hydrolase
MIGAAMNFFPAHVRASGEGVPPYPVLFLKPLSSIVGEGTKIVLPDTPVNHEVELGVMIGRSGKDISKESALDHVGGYFLALDLTAKDLAVDARAKGFPWSIAKGIDHFCPISKFIDKTLVRDPH